MGIRVRETLLAQRERLFPPRAEHRILLLLLGPLQLDFDLRRRPFHLGRLTLAAPFGEQAGFVAERVPHQDEREAVVPITAFSSAERSLREEMPQDRDFGVVVALMQRRKIRISIELRVESAALV